MHNNFYTHIWIANSKSLKSRCANYDWSTSQWALRYTAICRKKYIACIDEVLIFNCTHCNYPWATWYFLFFLVNHSMTNCTKGQFCQNANAWMVITVCAHFSWKYQPMHSIPRKGCHSDNWPAKIGDHQFHRPRAQTQTGTNNMHNETNNARTENYNAHILLDC